MSGARALGYLGPGGVPLFQVTRRKGGTLSGRYRSNEYVHQEENARPSVAIAGKSDRRTAASTGIDVPQDYVKNQNLGFYRPPARGLTG